MTVTHAYHDLPAELRGNALESHTGWPRQWTAPDADTAMRTRIALGSVIAVGGIDTFTIDVTAGTDGTTITLDRRFSL